MQRDTLMVWSKQLQGAVHQRDREALKLVLDEIEDECLGTVPFPDPYLEIVLELTSNHDFLEMDGSDTLFWFLWYQWTDMSADQKERIREAIIQSFPKLKDTDAQFTIVELLQSMYGDDLQLDTLIELIPISDETGRYYLVHGLADILAHSKVDEIKDRAQKELQRLYETDDSQMVRSAVSRVI